MIRVYHNPKGKEEDANIIVFLDCHSVKGVFRTYNNKIIFICFDAIVALLLVLNITINKNI